MQTRIVFICSAETAASSLRDSRRHPLLEGSFYVAEVSDCESLSATAEAVVAGPFQTEEAAEEARLLEERVDRFMEGEIIVHERDIGFLKHGFRDGYRTIPIESFYFTHQGQLYQYAYRAGEAERLAEQPPVAAGISETAKEKLRAIANRPRLQAAVEKWLGVGAAS